jgi:hypothetical protein
VIATKNGAGSGSPQAAARGLPQVDAQIFSQTLRFQNRTFMHLHPSADLA